MRRSLPGVFRWLTERRRRRILEHPFPLRWEAYLQANLAAYHLLDDDERQRLRELTQVFIAEKHWEGCGGLALTDEIKVTIAGQACLLILGRSHDLFRGVASILVYPSAVVMPPARPLHNQIVTAPIGDQVVIGAAHRGGPIVLAWDAVQAGGLDAHDGRNVVLHELAHAIDMLDHRADGTPLLDGAAQRAAWAEVCSQAYLALRARVDHDEPSLLRAYGATSEAEFFAVATEVFFEQPHELAREEPALYALLAGFYNLDLAARARR
ncbi:MAG: zinc-dependent peptidase [Deltaproteobacteria bacterium]|nr:zinc-dependent peptidase [Deltaproteobacteria bacterium]